MPNFAEYIDLLTETISYPHRSSRTSSREISCRYCGFSSTDGEHFETMDGRTYCKECIERHSVVCEVCGERHMLSNMCEFDGKYYCSTCFSLNFTHCRGCWDVHPRSEMIEVDGEYICRNCERHYFRPCHQCGEVHYTNNMSIVFMDDPRSTEHVYFCDNCLESNDSIWQCNHCGNYFLGDSMRYQGFENACACKTCIATNGYNDGDINHWKSPRGVKNYGYKPMGCFCMAEGETAPVNETIFLGYELEAEMDEEQWEYINEDCYGDPCDESADWVNDTLGYTYCKHDGSLDHGMEIVSHPATLAYHMSKTEDIKKLFKAMTNKGWRSHNVSTCGLHVHFSVKPVEDKNLFAIHNLLILVNRFWPYMVKFSRRTEAQLNHWAKRYLTGRIPYKDLKSYAKSGHDRRMAVNLTNENTVELRLFRGTLNPNSFMATLQFVQVLVDKCISLGSDADAVQRITWNELIKSDYAELNAYLSERGLFDVDDPSEPVPDNSNCSFHRNDGCAFSIGDRVHFTHPNEYDSYYNHDMPMGFECDGVIVGIREDTGTLSIEFDCEPCDFLHDLNGLISENRGQHCRAEHCERIEETECCSCSDSYDCNCEDLWA